MFMARLLSAAERQPGASCAAAPDNSDMFIDSLREIPLFGHHQPASTLGGLLYCFLLVAYALVVAMASWIFSSMTRLLPALLSSSNVVLLIITGTAMMLLVTVWQPIVHIPGVSISTMLRYGERARLAEQQTALLQYQRENLHYLSEEILRLQECLSKYERSENRNTPQRDQLHSELDLARSLIDERDSDIQQIRTVNDQYVEENDRLRDIIREWSARAAKLERALEDERISNADLHKKISMLRHSNEE